MSIQVRFPEQLDVFLPLVDGWRPISARDLNLYQDVIRKVQETLGSGANGTNFGSALYGPKAGSSDVAERLNQFLEQDGKLVDISFTHGTTRLGDFSEDRNFGFFVPFSKTLSSAGVGVPGYFVAMIFKTPGTEDVSGKLYYRKDVPACWWITSRNTDGCYITARQANHAKIDKTDSTIVEWACLAIGYKAFVTGA